jgi:hypothetical protein
MTFATHLVHNEIGVTDDFQRTLRPQAERRSETHITQSAGSGASRHHATDQEGCDPEADANSFTEWLGHALI